MVRLTRIAALAILWLVPICIFSVAFSGDWVSTWRVFGIPSATPRFLDLSSIPAGIETMHGGGDPLAANPADANHRPMNYPRIWLYIFSAARISRDNLSIAALLFCALYLVCASFLILHATHAADMAILLVASLSLSPLLAMERGNNDLLVFAIVFVACVTANKYLKSIAFGFAALLKIYPMAAMMLDAIRRPAKERYIAVIATAVVIVLFALQWRDLMLIRHSTPVYRELSYGVLSLRDEVLFQGRRWEALAGSGWIITLECWLAAALAVSYGWRNSWEPSDQVIDPKYVELFDAFGAMYAFTFAIGSNWDYRLILLLPTLPLAFQMTRTHSHRVTGYMYMGLVIMAENTLGFPGNGGTLAGHLATFALFLMILGILTGESKKYLMGDKFPQFATADLRH